MKQKGLRFVIENFIVILINYGFHWVTARGLSPLDYGLLASFLGIFGILGVGALSLQTKAAEMASRQSESFQKKIHSTLSQSFLLGSLLTLGGVLSAPIWAKFLHTDPLIFIIFILIPLVNFPLSVVRGFLQGLQRLSLLSGSLLLESFLKLLATLWGFSQGYNLKFILLLLSLSQIPSLLWGLQALRKTKKEVASEEKTVEKSVSFKNLLSYFLLLGLWFNVDIIAFQAFFPTLSGGYGVITKFGQVILFFALTFTTFSFPQLVQIQEREAALFSKAFWRFGMVILGGETLGILGLFFLGSSFIPWLFGSIALEGMPFLIPYAVYCGLLGLVHYDIHAHWASGKSGSLKILWITSFFGFLFFISQLQKAPLKGVYSLVLLGLVLVLVSQKSGKKFAPPLKTP